MLKPEPEVDFFEFSSLNFSSFHHSILSKSLKNKPFFLEKSETEVYFFLNFQGFQGTLAKSLKNWPIWASLGKFGQVWASLSKFEQV